MLFLLRWLIYQTKGCVQVPRSPPSYSNTYRLLNGCGLGYRAHYYLLDLCYACNLLMLVSVALMLSLDRSILQRWTGHDTSKLPCMHCGSQRTC